MSTRRDRWYVVPEVWLILIMLGATMAGSISLAVTAFTHRDELRRSGPAIAAPLPPTHAHASDDVTP